MVEWRHPTFGMVMPGRKFSAGSDYRYGFNGKELDKEIAGTSTYDYGFRIYSPGLGRFLSVDPLTKSYPWNSTYSYAEGDVIRAIDLDGLEKYVVTNYYTTAGLEETLISVVSDRKTGDPQDMLLVHDVGKLKGESVATGYDVLVRNIRKNKNGKYTTTYERRNSLNSSESKILKTASEPEEQNNLSPFQMGFGGDADDGESITGNVPNRGFDSKQFKVSSFRMRHKVEVAKLDEHDIRNSAKKLFTEVDLNVANPNAGSVAAARKLGNLLKNSGIKQINITLTFPDPSGYSDFYSRPAGNGSIFGKNAESQLKKVTEIIEKISGVKIYPENIKVTTGGGNGISIDIKK